MADGIGKAVGQQLGELGKQIVKDIAKVPGQLTGFTDVGTQETKGQGAGASKQSSQQTAPPKTPTENVNPLAALEQQEQIEKAKKLERVRQELAAQFKKPVNPEEQPKGAFEQQKLEDLEKQKLEIKKMQEEAKRLQPMSTKAKRGNLFRKEQVKKRQQFGSEQSKLGTG